MKVKLYFYFIFTLIVLLISSCEDEVVTTEDTGPFYKGKSAKEFDAEILQDWMRTQLFLVQRNRGFTPMVAARAYGYMGLCAYESAVNGMPEYQSLAGQVTGLTKAPRSSKDKEYHWGLVTHTALSELATHLYINENSTDSSLLTLDTIKRRWDSRFKSEVSEIIYNNSIEYGKIIGQFMIEYAKSDGQEKCYLDANNYPKSYVYPTGDGKWAPQRNTVFAMQPYWGRVRTFYPFSAYLTQPPPPNSYSLDSSSIWWKEMKQVQSTDSIINTKSPEGNRFNIIAQYWNDEPFRSGTPAGHSVSIIRHIINKEKLKLDRAVEIYALGCMALHDAFVSCWMTKYNYSTVRPITYIRAYIQGNFTPKIGTPPFPDYTSGHSTQTGAVAEVLTKYFGDNYAFIDSTHYLARFDLPNEVVVPRSYKSFYEAADECSMSRLYGGIHVFQALSEGVKAGKKVGANIMTFKTKK